MIRLSIIIPVYNNVAYIGQAIDNYLSLATDKTELVIMDGGSTDGTLEVIKSYVFNNPNIIWKSQKDDGQSDAMNQGIAISSGDFISFLNVDDYYSPETFSQVLKIIENDSSIDFLVGDCNVWDEKGDLIYVNRSSKLQKWHVLSGYHFPVNPTAYFYKKNIHERVGFYNGDNHYNMDLEFLVQARLETLFTYHPITWGNFRVLPNTKTSIDSANALLEDRKHDLLRFYLRKQNSYLRFRVALYRLKRKNLPILKKGINIFIDKLVWEFKKRVQ
jgi:glycosyltransferase involved in cell wall biosynthesis